MIKKTFLSTLVCSLLIASCSEDNDTTEVNLAPTNFTVTTAEETFGSIALDWTDAEDPEGKSIRYDVFVNTEKKGNKLTISEYTIENLSPATTYAVRIEAIDDTGNKTGVDGNYTTLDAPVPSAVAIVQSEITETSFKISWEAATISDNSEITYDIYIDDLLISENTANQEFYFSALDPGTSYEIKVTSKSTYKTNAVSVETLATDIFDTFIKFGELDLPPGGPTRESLLSSVEIPIAIFNAAGASIATEKDIIVEFEVKGGVNEFDYNLITPSPLTIPMGSTEATIVVEIIDDGMEEDDETFSIETTNVTNAKVTGSTTSTFIIDGFVDGIFSPQSSTGYMVDITWNNPDVNIDAILLKEQSGGLSGSVAFFTTNDYPESFELGTNRSNGKYYLDLERNGSSVGPVEVSIFVQAPGDGSSTAFESIVYLIIPEGGSLRTVYEIDIVDGAYTFVEASN